MTRLLALLWSISVLNVWGQGVCPTNQTRATTESTILAESMRSENNNLSLQGNVNLILPSFSVFGDMLEYNLQENTLTSQKPVYFEQQYKRLWVDSFKQKSADEALLESAVFTSCLGNKEDLDWSFKVAKSEYKRQQNSIVLWHPRLEMLNVPILYLPWIDLPITRRSGLLTPKIGQYSFNSGARSGWFWQQPLFINIASNLDTTLSPTWLEASGLLLSNQLRWLSQAGKHQIELDYFTGENASQQQTDAYTDGYQRLLWQSEQTLITDIQFTIDWLDLDHRDYYSQFPSSLFDQRPTAAYNRYAALSKTWQQTPELDHHWRLSVEENYSLESTDQDGYRQYPHFSYQINRLFKPSWQELKLGLNAVNYQSSGDLRNYQNYSFQPTWLIPSLGLSNLNSSAEIMGFANAYQLEQQTLNDQKQAASEFNLFSYHLKLSFDKRFGWPKSTPQNTLNSSLKLALIYLYAPTIGFDNGHPSSLLSALEANHYTDLLSPYRFDSTDFAGPSNRLVALLQQQFWAADWSSQISLAKNINVVDEHNQSPEASIPIQPSYQDFFINAKFQRNQNQGILNLQWSEQQELRYSSLELLYSPSEWDILRLASQSQYRLADNDLEDDRHYWGIGLSKQLSNHWRILLQADYQEPQNQLFERSLGLQYDSCCWQSSLLWQQQVSANDSTSLDQSITFNIELKSLTRFGSLSEPRKTYYHQALTTDN